MNLSFITSRPACNKSHEDTNGFRPNTRNRENVGCSISHAGGGLSLPFENTVLVFFARIHVMSFSLLKYLISKATIGK